VLSAELMDKTKLMPEGKQGHGMQRGLSALLLHRSTNIIMRPISLSFLLIAVLFALNGCAPAYKAYSEEEPGVNFYKYRTFNWLDNNTVKSGNSGPEWLTERAQLKIRTSVETQMIRYGFQTCTEKPDLVLHYHIVIKNEVYFVPDWWCDEEIGSRSGRCHRIRPVNYQEGTLILDFIDASTGNQVWRGAAIGALENLSPQQADARIEEAIRLIFGKFPEKPVPTT
jgi:hypothetical protein